MADPAPSHAPSNAHADLMARDAARVYGWRYQPAIQFERGEGIWLLRRRRQALLRPDRRHDVQRAGPLPPGAGGGHARRGRQALARELVVFEPPSRALRRADCRHVAGRARGRELRGHGLGGQRGRHAHGARGQRQARHPLGDPRPPRRQPRGRIGDHHRRRPAASSGPAAGARQRARNLRALLLPLPGQPRIPGLRRGLPRAVPRADRPRDLGRHRRGAGGDHAGRGRHGGAAAGMAAPAEAARGGGRRAAGAGRGAACPGAHGQALGLPALRRDARHRHLRQGHERRPRDLRRGHDAGDRRAGAAARQASPGPAHIPATRCRRRSPTSSWRSCCATGSTSAPPPWARCCVPRWSACAIPTR